jgi:hypothetical protein
MLADWIMTVAKVPDPVLGTQDPGKPVLRRLTRLEYNNTVRDLFGLNLDLFIIPERLPVNKDYFNPGAGKMPDSVVVQTQEQGSKRPVVLAQAGLPADNRAEHGFTNRGDVMNVSPLNIEKYISVASELVNSPKLTDTAVFKALVATPHTEAAARQRISAFLTQAFRRDVNSTEVDRFAKVFSAGSADGGSFETGMKATVQAVLASPGFLYRLEGDDVQSPEKVRKLNGHELASRLSYFLWATMPDETLMQAANKGELNTPTAIETQVRRMLKDPKVRELSESFAVQWLRFDQLYTSQPDRELFRSFYSGPQGKDTGHASMLVEALLMFETVMIEDRSILDLVDPEYAYLNSRLMKLYRMDKTSEATDKPDSKPADNREKKNERNASANTWKRVELADKNRGGVLTLGGAMMVTSLPFRTSPVKRGAWILETVFNRPPSEPKVAFTIDNDTKEAAQEMSIRQKFEMHRDSPACYSCHVRLDPPGFALERFSPIGQWRDMDGKQAVDSTSVWNGQAFDGPAGFKALVMKNPHEFTRGFIEHLLTYALGRKLEIYDMPVVEKIAADAKADGWKFSRILTGIATSYPFTHIRNLPQ